MSTRPTPEQLDALMTPSLQELRRDPRGWAFDISGGWYQIVADLDRELEPHAFWFRYSQIKEKFGELRIYVDYAAHTPGDVLVQIRSATTRARERAATTCETCGDAGATLRTDGWWRTICDDCEIERTARRGQQ